MLHLRLWMHFMHKTALWMVKIADPWSNFFYVIMLLKHGKRKSNFIYTVFSMKLLSPYYNYAEYMLESPFYLPVSYRTYCMHFHVKTLYLLYSFIGYRSFPFIFCVKIEYILCDNCNKNNKNIVHLFRKVWTLYAGYFNLCKSLLVDN